MTDRQKTATGWESLSKICEALALPARTCRVLIDIEMDSVVKVYVVHHLNEHQMDRLTEALKEATHVEII